MMKLMSKFTIPYIGANFRETCLSRTKNCMAGFREWTSPFYILDKHSVNLTRYIP